MQSMNRTTQTILIFITLLTVNLCVCGVMAYAGAGLQDVGPEPPPSVRSGSVGGPIIFGGGPSSGK